MSKKLDFIEVEQGSAIDPEVSEIRKSIYHKSRVQTSFQVKWDLNSPLNKEFLPMAPGDFFANVLHKKHFHQNSVNQKRFEHLFSLRKLSALIAKKAIPESQLLMVEHLNGEYKKDQFADPMQIAQHFFEEKGSIVVDRLDTIDETLGQLAIDFRKWTNQNVVVNCYITPKGANSFRWHWDTHDVFLLQIEGSKYWELHEPALVMPSARQKYFDLPEKNATNSKVIQKLTIKKGDVLYIPRGMPHIGRAVENETSMHITIGVLNVTALDVLERVINDVLFENESELMFRAEFNRETDIKQLVAKTVSKIKAKDWKRAADLEKQKLNRGNFSVQLPLDAWNALLSFDDLYAQNAILKTEIPFFLDLKSDSIAVGFQNKKIIFDIKAQKALKFIHKNHVFWAKSLPRNGLSKTETKELVEILVTRGLLKFDTN